MATDEELEAIAGRLVAFAQLHGVTRAIVEEATDVHFDPAMGDAAKASMASALVRSGKVGAVVALRLRDAGIVVVRVRHATWAGRIAKSAGVKPKQVKPVIIAAVTGWPAQSNEHERDGGGIAVWDVVVSAEEEAERNAPPRAKRVRAYVPRACGVRRAAEEKRATRRAAGCECKGTHKLLCPLYSRIESKRCRACELIKRSTVAALASAELLAWTARRKDPSDDALRAAADAATETHARARAASPKGACDACKGTQ